MSIPMIQKKIISHFPESDSHKNAQQFQGFQPTFVGFIQSQL
jgi:hypothetical protein